MTRLPQSEESEKSLLSAWLADPVNVGGVCAVHGVNSNWFLNTFCISLHGALHAIWGAGKTPTHAALVERMKADGAWGQECPQLMHEVRTFAPLPSAAPMFIETLRDKAILRNVIGMCQKLGSEAWEATESASVVTAAVRDAAALQEIGVAKTTQTLAQHAAEYARELINGDGGDKSLKTGLRKLDAASPLNLGDMVSISGERKAGKSILSLTIALHVAEKFPILYFSLEDKIKKLIRRVLSNMSKVPALAHRNPNGSQEMQMSAGLDRINQLDFTLHDDVQDLAEIVGVVRQAKVRRPATALCVVDYLQLVRGTRQKGDNRETEVATVSRTLRLLAMETNIAFIVLSQLNTDGATRESRAIENDITAMWKLSLVEDQPGVRMLEIPFQRDGDSGIGFRVAFLGDRATVEDLYDGNPD